MKKILITRKLLNSSEKYASEIFDVKLNKEDKLLTKEELINKSVDCDGILSSITDKLDADIIFKLSNKVKIICFLLPFLLPLRFFDFFFHHKNISFFT